MTTKPSTANISVVIVNYNSGALLTETVGAVLQSTVAVDVFVSDNGSIDDSITRLKTALGDRPNLHIFENHANLGFSRGNNVVLPKTSGEFVLFLNPDCRIEPTTLSLMIDAMENYSDVGMAGCLIHNPDGSEQPGCRRNIPTPISSLIRVLHLSKLLPSQQKLQDFNLTGTALPDSPCNVEAISGAFMLVRRSAMEKVGPLDDGYFLHCEDLDWCMRFRQNGFRILFVPQVVVTHEKGGCSINRPIFVEWHKHRGMARFYHKFFRHQYSFPLMGLVYIGIWARFLSKAMFLIFRRYAS